MSHRYMKGLLAEFDLDGTPTLMAADSNGDQVSIDRDLRMKATNGSTGITR